MGTYEWYGITYAESDTIARVKKGVGNIKVGKNSISVNGLPGVSVSPPTKTQSPVATQLASTMSNLPTGAGNSGPLSSWGKSMPHPTNGTTTSPTGVVTKINITHWQNGNTSGTKTVYDPNTGLRTISTFYNGGKSVHTTTVKVSKTSRIGPVGPQGRPV